MNIVSIGIFGLIFLSVTGLINSTAPANLDNIQDLFDRMDCPLPSITGLWNNTGTIEYSGGTYNYPDVGTQVITLTCTQVHTLNGFDYAYGSPTIPFAGMPFFFADFISEVIANKLTAFFELIGFLLSPANLSVLGFTVADASQFAQFIIGIIYLFCYVSIGALLYKIISPFAGAS